MNETIKFSFGPYGVAVLPLYIKPLDCTTMIPVERKVDTGADFTVLSKTAHYTMRNSTEQFEICRTQKFKPLYKFLPGQSVNEVA
jgi:hypothetical protein